MIETPFNDLRGTESKVHISYLYYHRSVPSKVVSGELSEYTFNVPPSMFSLLPIQQIPRVSTESGLDLTGSSSTNSTS